MQIFRIGQPQENIDKRRRVVNGHAEERACQIAYANEEAYDCGLVETPAVLKHAQKYDRAGDDVQQACLNTKELGILQKLVVGRPDMIGVEQTLDTEKGTLAELRAELRELEAELEQIRQEQAAAQPIDLGVINYGGA